MLTLYKIDKKYYFLNTTLGRLRSEGWQYFSLTGRYSGHLIHHNNPTHRNQFVYFTHYIEKIKMKQVEEEYYKAEEKPAQTPSTAQKTSAGIELYPPSPDQPLNSMVQVPEPVKDAMNSLIKSQRTKEQQEQKEQKEQKTSVPELEISEVNSPVDNGSPTDKSLNVVVLPE
jgi:hypothetical protein